MAASKIEWTEATWNPVTGCDKISAGCLNCYAERMARRLQAMGQPHYSTGFNIALHPESLETPLTWKKPQMVFVNSMSDLFHKNVPDSFILDIFNVMRKAKWHIFQVLTKRSERMENFASKLVWPSNVWMGVTIERADYVFRARHLKNVPAKVRFLSMEPLLGPVRELDLSGIHWVIVGGESGPGARPMEEPWILDIRKQCGEAGVPFFFKQWGGVNKKKAGWNLDGKTYDEWPRQARTLTTLQG
jgi:protein gp37